MITLNESDNQGIRSILVDLAGKAGDIDTMEWVVEKYLFHGGSRTCDPSILYTNALLGHIRGIDEVEKRRRLREAIKANVYIAVYLLHPEEVPVIDDQIGYITAGGKDEAVEYIKHGAMSWGASAISWLRECENPRRENESAFDAIVSESTLVNMLERNRSLLIYFRKADGTMRLMYATRSKNFIPLRDWPKNGIRPHQNGSAIHVYDYMADNGGPYGAWRSFKYETVESTPFFDVLIDGGFHSDT